MKGFYWGKGKVRCSYCGSHGHNITTCKVVSKHADIALNKFANMPDYVPSYREHMALNEIKRREERKVKLRKPKKAPACSFCGSLEHKRPKCKQLIDFKNNTYKANKNWKSQLVSSINEKGLGVGSLVQFYEGLGPKDFVLGVVTDISYNNLNIFCSFTGDLKYQSNAAIEVLIGTDVHNVNIKSFSGVLGNALVAPDYWFLDYIEPNIINPMSWTPDEDWLNSEWDEIFDWFFKDVNLKTLQSKGIIKLINNWANKI